VKTRQIRPDQKVPVTFTDRERALVIDHTFAGGELTEPLEGARAKAGTYVVRYTLDDIEELLGYVAAEANHATNKKLKKELDALFARLQDAMQSYDDGQWQEQGVTLGVAKKQSSESARSTLSVGKGRERP
jgi:hypothetical protein